MKLCATVVSVAGSALVLFSGCDPTSSLATQRAIWAANAPSSYTYVVQRSCFCASESIAPYRVRVENGQPVSVTRADTGAAATVANVEGLATIEQVFDFAAEALTDAEQVEIRYDLDYGYPEEIAIDYILLAIDDEVTINVSDLQPAR